MKKISNSPRSAPALLDEIRTAPCPPETIISKSFQSSPDIGVPLPDVRSDGEKSPGSNYILHGPNNREVAEPDTLEFDAIEDLNWTDWDEILRNKGLFDPGYRVLLEVAKSKKDNFSEGFAYGNYFDNILPIVCGGYVAADKIVYCGNNNIKGYKVPCDQWTLCSKCAYVKGINPSEAFDGTYSKDTFYHITLGFSGDISFDISTSESPKNYWRANETALRHLLNTSCIRGAYIAHELKIRTLAPIRVNPHSHAIVTASEFPDELKRVLGQMISDMPGVCLVPSIEVKLIDSKQYHQKCIRYLTKAVELKEPYESAWQKMCVPDRSNAHQVNLSMRNFLDAYAAACSGINKRIYLGNLMSQSKTFIGVPVKDRPSIIKQKELRANRKKVRRERRIREATDSLR